MNATATAPGQVVWLTRAITWAVKLSKFNHHKVNKLNSLQELSEPDTEPFNAMGNNNISIH